MLEASFHSLFSYDLLKWIKMALSNLGKDKKGKK
jgi:hypothetical protein